MGQNLSEPKTDKKTDSYGNEMFAVGASCMQGWRLGILSVCMCMYMYMCMCMYYLSAKSKDVASVVCKVAMCVCVGRACIMQNV